MNNLDQVPDYVIVGGGSAGCVLAARLSENHANKVVLLEAGGSGDGFLVRMPAGTAKLMGDAEHDWCLKAEPDPSIGGRSLQWGAGKGLGGGSSINGQVYIRGQRSDYDAWAEEGCAGWSFDDVLPYFLRSERFHGPESQSHGQLGPLDVSPVRTPQPISKIVLDAFAQSGLPILDDYCGGEQFGAFPILATQVNGQRCSAARAFLEPARSRPNLHIITNATVEKIVIKDRRAIGVIYRRGPETLTIMARAEVLLCAGTAHSPAILMRSGIGPGQELRDHGISVEANLPGVGGNLCEHPTISISKLVDIPTISSQLGPLKLAGHLLRYLFFRSGMLTTPAVQVMAAFKTDPSLKDPDILLSMLPVAVSFTSCGEAKIEERASFSFGFHVARPYSRGRIRLRSPDPAAAPVIDHRLLGDGRDAATLVRGCRIIEDVCRQPALANHITGNLRPELIPSDEPGWLDYVRANASIGYHMVGTCRIGRIGDPGAVVDATLRVAGIKGLRVIDASVMPSLVSANTNAPTIMIAEKGAAMITHR
jgi:choline dehydrogenase